MSTERQCREIERRDRESKTHSPTPWCRRPCPHRVAMPLVRARPILILLPSTHASETHVRPTCYRRRLLETHLPPLLIGIYSYLFLLNLINIKFLWFDLRIWGSQKLCLCLVDLWCFMFVFLLMNDELNWCWWLTDCELNLCCLWWFFFFFGFITLWLCHSVFVTLYLVLYIYIYIYIYRERERERERERVCSCRD